MKFNLRLMMVWTGIICFVLFVFRIPLTYFIDSFLDGGKCYELTLIAINPFRHLGYVVGYETEYVDWNINGRHVNFLEFCLFVCVPIVVSVFLHVVLFGGFCAIYEKLNKWANNEL